MKTIADCLGKDNHFNLLRVMAATGVLVSHAFPLSLGWEALEPFEIVLKGENLGRLCVFVFFAISGFFISSSYINQNSPARFIRARALRILPGLYAMLLLTVIFASFLKTGVGKAEFWAGVPAYLLSQATMDFAAMFGLGQSVGSLPGVFSNNPLPTAINGSLWSLPMEVVCYVGVLVCGLAGILRKKRLFALIVLACTTGYVFRLVALDQGLKLPFFPQVLVYVGFPFIVGMAFRVWADRIILSNKIALALAAIAVLAWPTPLFLLAFVLALSYSVFLFGFADLPALAGYNRVGDYSYGIYIYAFPIQQTVAMLGVREPIINILVALPLTLMCAIFSWHVVEKPFLRFKSKGASRPKSAVESRTNG